MSENYPTELAQIEQFYQYVCNLIDTGNYQKVSLQDLKLTLQRIDNMLKHIQQSQKSGIDIARIMYYQDKYQALYCEYDYATKNKVQKEEFEQNLKRILNRRPQTIEQQPIQRQLIGGSSGHFMLTSQNNNGGLTPMGSNFPQNNQPSNVYDTTLKLYMASQLNTNAQTNPERQISNQPYNLITNGATQRVDSSTSNEINRRFSNQINQPIPQQMSAGQIYGMNGKSIPQYSPEIMPNLAHGPWQNPNPGFSSTNPPSNKLIMPSVNLTLQAGSPPPLQSISSPQSINESSFNPWHNTNPWAGPPTSPPLSVVERMGVNNPTGGFLANAMMPPPNQINSPIRSPQQPSHIITTTNISSKSLQYIPAVPSDPWNNTTPWAKSPTVTVADNGRHLTFGGSVINQNIVAATYQQNVNSANSPHRSNSPTLSLDLKHSGSIDPWTNNNPWPGPPTENPVGLAVATGAKNYLIHNQAGSDMGARALTDSIVGKLYADNQYQGQPQYLSGFGPNQTGLPVNIGLAIARDVQQRSQGVWHPPSSFPIKPASSSIPAPAIPGGQYIIPTASEASFHEHISFNDMYPGGLLPPSLPTTISAIRGVAPPSQPVVLETRVIAPPMIYSTKVVQQNRLGQPARQILSSITTPSIIPSGPLARSRMLNSKNQSLTPQEQLQYKSKLDQLFSLPLSTKNISFKSQIQLNPISRSGKSAFQKKRDAVHHTKSQSEQFIRRLQNENEELKEQLRVNSQMISKNTVQVNEVIRNSRAVQANFNKNMVGNVDRVSQNPNQSQQFEQSQDPSQNLQFNQSAGQFYDKATGQPLRPQTTNIEKYIISNEMLKRQNEQIHNKINELQDVLQQLTKQNMQLKEIEMSGQRSANAPSGNARTPIIETGYDQNNILPKKTSNESSLSNSIIHSHNLSGQREQYPFLQPNIRPVQYVHTDGSNRSFPSNAPNMQHIKMPFNRTPKARLFGESFLQKTAPGMRVQYVETSSTPMITPVVPPQQVITVTNRMSFSPRTIKQQVVSPLVPSSFKNTNSNTNMLINNFYSRHNTSQNYALNTSQSLWINERSIMEKNEEERRYIQNKYILPPTTNDLNKVNVLNSSYGIKRTIPNMGQTNIKNSQQFYSFNQNPRSIRPGFMQSTISNDQQFHTENIVKEIFSTGINPTMSITRPQIIVQKMMIQRDIVKLVGVQNPQSQKDFNHYSTQPSIPAPQQVYASTHNNDDGISSYQALSTTRNVKNNRARLSAPFAQFPQDLAERSFDTFKLVDSVPDASNSFSKIEHDSVQTPTALLNTTAAALTRNKVAFFKKSLVLIRDDPQLEVAFKRSNLNPELDTVRLIFYVNNKSVTDSYVIITYEYDESMYHIQIGEKLTTVQAGKQGREQLTITLRDQPNPRPMSFIVCHFKLGSRAYDILMPVLFMTFTEGINKQLTYGNKILQILPNRQFTSPHFLYTLMPLTYINYEEEVEYLKGEKPYKTDVVVTTKRGRHSLKMDWFHGLVKITGDNQWIDMIAWLIADIRL